MHVLNENKARFEPWGDMVDNVLLNDNFSPRTDQFAEQENDNIQEEDLKKCITACLTYHKVKELPMLGL